MRRDLTTRSIILEMRDRFADLRLADSSRVLLYPMLVS